MFLSQEVSIKIKWDRLSASNAGKGLTSPKNDIQVPVQRTAGHVRMVGTIIVFICS